MNILDEALKQREKMFFRKNTKAIYNWVYRRASVLTMCVTEI